MSFRRSGRRSGSSPRNEDEFDRAHILKIHPRIIEKERQQKDEADARTQKLQDKFSETRGTRIRTLVSQNGRRATSPRQTERELQKTWPSKSLATPLALFDLGIVGPSDLGCAPSHCCRPPPSHYHPTTGAAQAEARLGSIRLRGCTTDLQGGEPATSRCLHPAHSPA
jgi:hypothetical protein